MGGDYTAALRRVGRFSVSALSRAHTRSNSSGLCGVPPALIWRIIQNF